VSVVLHDDILHAITLWDGMLEQGQVGTVGASACLPAVVRASWWRVSQLATPHLQLAQSERFVFVCEVRVALPRARGPNLKILVVDAPPSTPCACG
jgi:hypothetical protein